jgi:hypothetical protein
MRATLGTAARRTLAASGLTAGTLVPAAPLHAQGWVEHVMSRAEGGSTIVRESSSVRVLVDGRTVRLEVTEPFRNDGSAVAEGSSLYPVPGEAVPRAFRCGWANGSRAER